MSRQRSRQNTARHKNKNVNDPSSVFFSPKKKEKKRFNVRRLCLHTEKHFPLDNQRRQKGEQVGTRGGG